MKIRNVVIVNAGTIGHSLAHIFAVNPHLNVKLKTQILKPDRFLQIETNLDTMISRGAMTQAEKSAILERIRFVTDDSEAYADADFILECYPEVMETKQDLFAHIEQFCREDTILATNTSFMSPTEISQKCKNRERVVGTHFWNPGHLVPLVEVVKSDYTAEEVIEATMELLTAWVKKAIYCKKDVPGFVANRLQHALWREAIYMVEKDIADPKTVDDACKFGPG
jgi:3-hydroxybutyryl-CoA dehydrogenase